ncbi:MAG: protein kinase [Deltaproteobacteria bacterium]|nr:protein kinase [Deltaproteobacteria bacterium]
MQKELIPRPSSIPPPLGRNRVGRYEVLSPIAQGGMASVHLGRLSGMAGFQKLVAIKVIHSHLAKEKSFVEMFLDEARHAARIQHPNVGEILEVGEENGLYFMIGEFIQGQNLRAFFRKAKRAGVEITPAVSAWIASNVCLGLHAAHELTSATGESLNLVHRDVSPLNILISYDGFVKLIDFGVASARGQMQRDDSGALKGKIGYMAPEQIKGEPIDGRSDVFSLGVVLYKMITGYHPFSGKDPEEQLGKIISGEFTPPRILNPRIPINMERIITTAMTNSPDDRYPSAKAMSADLERFNRLSAKEIDTAKLSELMHELFEDEYAEQQKQLHAIGEKIEETADEYMWPVSEPSTTFDKRKELKRARIAAAVGAIAALVAAIVAIVFSFSTATEPPELTAAPSTLVTPEPVVVSPKPEPEPEPEPVKTEVKETVEPKLVKLVLEISPEGATVELDGKSLEIGESEVSLPADQETHQLVVSADEYEPWKTEFVANADRVFSIQLKPKEIESVESKKRKKRKKRKGDFDINRSPYD